MKNNILKKLMAIVCLLVSLNAFAARFEVDGINYITISETDNIVRVTSKFESEYTGDIIIPETVIWNENVYSVISIGDGAFSNSSNLTSVTISNGITSIGNSAFQDCKKMINVSIPNSVTSINQYAFSGCSSLINIKIPEGVKSIDLGTFYGCSNLSTITLPNTITDINDETFSGCSNLTSITIPDNVTFIGDYAFNGCSSITSMILPKTIKSIGNKAFRGCSSLVSIDWPESTPIISIGTFERCSGLTSITIPNSVTSIGDEAFIYCYALTDITIPSSVTSIGESAFAYCYEITNFTIPNSVTSINNRTFLGCTALISIEIPNNITTIGEYAFKDCIGLTSIYIPNSVTNIENAAFSSSGLTSISIPNSVKSIGKSAFESCMGLTTINIPNSITVLNSSIFDNCWNLAEVILPNTITSIGERAFKATDLSNIIIPNSVTKIGNYAFDSCDKLSSIKIPNSVNKIGNYTFQDCSGLEFVTLGNQLSSIGVYAFKDCNNINKVESLNPTAPTMTETVFPTTVYENAQLVVPLGAEESYQSSTGWSKFTNTSAGYNVTVDYSNTGGVVSINDSNETTVSVDFDTKVDFVITPKEGFEIEKVTLNEEDITENVVDGKYSLEKLTEDVTFAVTFRKLYTIATIFNSEEGVVTINGQEKNPIKVSFDTKVDFEITPNEGYEIDKVLLNEIDVTPDVAEGKYSIDKASEDVALNVTFRKLLIIGATFNNEEGRVTINGAEVNPILVSTGSTLDFVITSNEGYEIDKVLLNEVDVTEHLQEGLLHIENVAGNVVLNVTFRKMMLIVTEFASEYGSVTINESEETSMFVSLGSKLDFTITPNEGYEIINVTLNDEDITADAVEGKYTIENATENVKLIVTFKLKTFALVLKCSEAGAFKRILNYGETATYEIVPSENWEINTVTLNGTDVTTELVDNVFTTPEITEDSELSVVFVDLATSVFSVYNTSDVKVYASQQTINIKGLEDNTPVAVYNPNGQMEYNKVATDYEMNINMNKDGVYLVKVGEKTFKVML